MTHAGNVFLRLVDCEKTPRRENRRSAAASAAWKWRRENPVC